MENGGAEIARTVRVNRFVFLLAKEVDFEKQKPVR